jgi:U32 family peptidase
MAHGNDIEVMAPVGSWAALHAAIKAGADSIYFGVDKLNMRARSSYNFTLEDLKAVVVTCSEQRVKTYLTLNIVVYDEEVLAMREVCDAALGAGITAVIAHDMAVISYASSIGLNVHISTQANVCNTEAVLHYAQYSDVIVLARELTLPQIQKIVAAIEEENICGPSGEKVRIEIFVHGALCVGVSGKCYMSLAQYNYSANRGACLQACRRKYRVSEEETGQELVIDNEYIFSPKDLCTISFLDEIIAAGVSVLKIEGRGRSPDYVYTVTKTYKDAVASIEAKEYSPQKIEAWLEQLKKVYNRGFWQGGYYLGKELGEWCNSYGSQATKRKEYVGKVTNYFSKIGVAEFKIESGALEEGDEMMIIGDTTGVVKAQATEIKHHGKGVITVRVAEKVRCRDAIYVVKEREQTS